MNPNVKARYFSHTSFSPNTSIDYFLTPKPAGTYRIFCLGGSTTIGFPYGYAGSFSAFLQDRLKKIFPEKSIETINLGMTATNSYTVVDMAREIVDYAPDLIIVYDGHNEFYGALGIASNESLGGSRFLVKMYLRLIQVRSFLLLRSAIDQVKTWLFPVSENSSSGTMMEKLARGQQVPYGSAIYQKGLDIFRANLEELKDICRAKGIPVILSTQVSNLKDQPPFVSEFQTQVSTTSRNRYESAMARGLQFEIRGTLDSALIAFQTAKDIDSLRADARYAIARNLGKKRMPDQARREYIAARDYDQLRFRTSSDFNDAIKNACDNNYVLLADIEQTFLSYSPDSIVGKNLILEHLHPNLRGYFLLAKKYSKIMRDRNFIAAAGEWKKADSVTDEELWNQKTITEIDEWSAQWRTAVLTSSWPFKLEEATPFPPLTDKEISRIVQNLLSGKTTWEETHVTAAEYYERIGDFEKTAMEYRELMNRLPLNVSSYLRLGQLYANRGKFDEAKQVLARSLSVEETPYAYQLSGQIDLEQGKLDAGISNLEKAFGLTQTVDERADAGYRLALAYLKADKPERAIAPLEHVVRIKPQLRAAKKLLDQLNAQKK